MDSESRPYAWRRPARQLIAAVLSAWLCGTAQLSRAQPQPTAAERETARALMQEGDQLSASGDQRAALTRYTAAHALMNIPTTGLDVARTQAKLGLLVEARGLALEVSNSVPVAGEPRVFARARSGAAELARDIDGRIPSLRTQVGPGAAAYSVTIDGVTLPSAARMIAFRTNPGPHVVVVAAPGYVTQRREIRLTERQTATLSITLTSAPGNAAAGPAPTPAPGMRKPGS